MSRILPFDTVYNFRDFGDYPSRDGRSVARGKLFLSANLSRLDGSDMARFEAMNISAIIDMRYAPERKKQPNNLPHEYGGVTLAYNPGAGQADIKVAPHEAFLEHDLESAEDARGYMLASYARRPLDKGFQNLVRTSLKHMASTGDNVLIHCAAGKDRTGTFVAIIQHLLGVDESLIIDDYMLTLQAVDMEPLLEMASQQISTRYGRAYNADMLRPLFGVSEDYLQNAMDKMGNIDNYVSDVIGISAKEKAALATYYLT